LWWRLSFGDFGLTLRLFRWLCGGLGGSLSCFNRLGFGDRYSRLHRGLFDDRLYHCYLWSRLRRIDDFRRLYRHGWLHTLDLNFHGRLRRSLSTPSHDTPANPRILRRLTHRTRRSVVGFYGTPNNRASVGCTREPLH